jgi:hypothetical protein
VSFTAARDSSHKSIEQVHSNLNVSIHSSGVFGRGVRHGVTLRVSTAVVPAPPPDRGRW